MTLKEKLAKAKEDLAEIKKLVENGEKVPRISRRQSMK